MKPGLILGLVIATAVLAVPGCGREDAGGPPTIVLGDSVCNECGMIVSDERFATATIVQGQRGPEPRVFDDFNCQYNYERAHAGEAVITRWSHGYLSSVWIPTEGAIFLRSPGLRTPMGSGVAAFGTRAEAEQTKRDLEGDQSEGPAGTPDSQVMSFEKYWSQLRTAGG